MLSAHTGIAVVVVPTAVALVASWLLGKSQARTHWLLIPTRAEGVLLLSARSVRGRAQVYDVVCPSEGLSHGAGSG